jgi:hypothetical protein
MAITDNLLLTGALELLRHKNDILIYNSDKNKVSPFSWSSDHIAISLYVSVFFVPPIT